MNDRIYPKRSYPKESACDHRYWMYISKGEDDAEKECFWSSLSLDTIIYAASRVMIFTSVAACIFVITIRSVLLSVFITVHNTTFLSLLELPMWTDLFPLSCAVYLETCSKKFRVFFGYLILAQQLFDILQTNDIYKFSLYSGQRIYVRSHFCSP